jgi:hypothetical protein
VVRVRIDVSEEHIASIFRVKEFPWFAARIYLTKNGEESLL